MEKHWKKELMLAVEWPLYNKMFATMNPRDVAFIKHILTGINVIRGPNGDKYRVNATRMSGEMNTSLANGWCNFVIFAHLVALKGGVFYGYVEGDDGIFASSVDITSEDYAKLGFDVKVVHHDSISTASFCSMVVARDGTALKDPERFLNGFGWTHSFIHAGETIMMELLRAKALSALYEACSSPITSVLARAALDFTKGVTPRFVADGYHKLPDLSKEPPPTFITEVARADFAKTFGIPIQLQLDVEDAIKRHDMDMVGLLLPPRYEKSLNVDMSHYVRSCVYAD